MPKKTPMFRVTATETSKLHYADVERMELFLNEEMKKLQQVIIDDEVTRIIMGVDPAITLDSRGERAFKRALRIIKKAEKRHSRLRTAAERMKKVNNNQAEVREYESECK